MGNSEHLRQLLANGIAEWICRNHSKLAETFVEEASVEASSVTNKTAAQLKILLAVSFVHGWKKSQVVGLLLRALTLKHQAGASASHETTFQHLLLSLPNCSSYLLL